MKTPEDFRQQRHALFLEFIRGIPTPATVLDVGGTVEFWIDKIPTGWNLTIINPVYQEPQGDEIVIEGSGCKLPFPSKSFDLIFSNSALAFVGGWREQQQAAAEIQRVGKRYWVQTPNKAFFLDWRTYVPFFHWLSPAHQAWIQSRVAVGRYPRAIDWGDAWSQATRVRDVNRMEVRRLFPRGKIVNEKAFGVLTKSFIIHS
jgi:hypothetical protein